MDEARIRLARPVATYDGVQPYFMKHASVLASELDEHCLSVSLAPAPEQRFVGHCIRVVDSRNPPWYQSFFHQYDSARRDRTASALEKIAEAADKPADAFPFASYHQRVRSMIYDHLAQGYTSMNGCVPANNSFRENVGLPCVENGMSVDVDRYDVSSETTSYRGRRVEAPF